MKVLILGAGYSGQAIGASFRARGAEVHGTTRTLAKAERLELAGITPLIFDGETISPELESVMAQTTHLIQSIAPGRDGDPLFRPGMPATAALMPRLQWMAYLSTVGVYGDHRGNWVDEETSCHPVSARSLERVEAEDRWMAAGRETGSGVAILRLSGIYGPGRNAFKNLADGTARRLIKKDQVFNRIRVEDIGAATLFLAERSTGGIFNITDHEPAAPQDVVTEAARLMGVEPPPETAFETAELSAMARSFYGENKRVSNRKITDLGYTFRFPDYRVSLADLWSNGTWQG